MFIIVVFTVAAKLNFHIVRMLKCVLFKECIFGYNHRSYGLMRVCLCNQSILYWPTINFFEL